MIEIDLDRARFLFIYLAYTPKRCTVCAHFLTKNLETLNSIRPRDDGKDKKSNSCFIYLCDSKPSPQPERPSRPCRNLEKKCTVVFAFFYLPFFYVYSYSTFLPGGLNPTQSCMGRKSATIQYIRQQIYKLTMSVINCRLLIKVALSACRCRVQLFNRKCSIIEERNVMALSFCSLTPVSLRPNQGNSD